MDAFQAQKKDNAKYRRETVMEGINQSQKWGAMGCNSYMVVNHGNVNVTINGVFVLRPGQWFCSPDDNPDVSDHTSLDIQFDDVSLPTYVAPDTGTSPSTPGGAPNVGDPTPLRDKRVVILKSYLSLNN